MGSNDEITKRVPDNLERSYVMEKIEPVWLEDQNSEKG